MTHMRYYVKCVHQENYFLINDDGDGDGGGLHLEGKHFTKWNKFFLIAFFLDYFIKGPFINYVTL